MDTSRFIKIFSIVILLAGSLVLFNNMGGKLVKGKRSKKERVLSVQEIADEINILIDRIENKEFGENGGLALGVFLAKNINYLAVKLKAKTCREVKAYVPKMPTGRYLLWHDSNGSLKFCQSTMDFVNHVYEAINRRKPSKNGMVKWLRIYKEKGFQELVVDIALRDEFSKKNPSLDEQVNAIFNALLTRKVGVGLPGWRRNLDEKGIAHLVRAVAKTPESQKKNESHLEGLEGFVDKLKVKGGKLVFKGWACQVRLNQPLEVEIFVGGDKKEVRRIATTLANLNKYDTEQDCQNGRAFAGFEVKVKFSDVRALEREPVEVFASNPHTGVRQRLTSKTKNLRLPRW